MQRNEYNETKVTRVQKQQESKVIKNAQSQNFPFRLGGQRNLVFFFVFPFLVAKIFSVGK